jgi:hypothetical protein
MSRARTNGAKLPVRRDDLRVQRHAHGGTDGVIVDARGQEVSLNATAYAVWQQCDGVTTVEELIDAICMLFRTHPDDVRTDIERTLEALRDARLIHWEGSGA